jgi:hypothetical protein
MRIGGGYSSAGFVIARNLMETDLRDPSILFLEKKLPSVWSLMAASGRAAVFTSIRQGLVIVTDDLDRGAIASLTESRLDPALNTATFETPGRGNSALFIRIMSLCEF